jgi:5'-nucleotidase
MSNDRFEPLVVGISSRTLFDLRQEDEIFRTKGLEEYRRYQIEHEKDALAPGVGFPMAKALQRLGTETGRPVEVVIMSKQSADTSPRLFSSAREHGLDIGRAALTGGQPLPPYLEAFRVGLFLSSEEDDLRSAISAGVAAGRVHGDHDDADRPADQVRIAFEGDALLFSDAAERAARLGGMESTSRGDPGSAAPEPEGPFARFVKALCALQSAVTDPARQPIRTALLTNRASPAEDRAMRALRAWKVRLDEAFFLGDGSREDVLRAFRPHLIFAAHGTHYELPDELAAADAAEARAEEEATTSRFSRLRMRAND